MIDFSPLPIIKKYNKNNGEIISWINQPNLQSIRNPNFLLENFPYGAVILNSKKKEIIAKISQGINIILYKFNNIIIC